MASEKGFCFFVTKIYMVYVVSKFPQNSLSLLVHCALGNNDLGNHILIAIQDFHFDFCINYW